MEFDYRGRSKKGELLVQTEELSGPGYIVFFEKYILAITPKKSFVKAANKEQKKKYKEAGIGFFKRMGKIDDYWEERLEYEKMSEILKNKADENS